MTKQDKVALIAFMRATEEKAKRKLDACVPLLLWLALRFAVRTAAIKGQVEILYRQFGEPARAYARRILRRVLRGGAGYLFFGAVVVLSAAATVRSHLILYARACRVALASGAESLDWRAFRRPALRIAEAALWIIAGATLGYCGYAYASAALHQQQQKAAFKALKASAHPDELRTIAQRPREAPSRGELLGILDIPRIGLSSIVEQGADSKVLRESVGHIPGTALPGQSGNVALAAHRDTYFRHLSALRPGDKIVFHSLSGTYTYRVQSTKVVQPTDTAVLVETEQPTLTLVTCFPFYYVGSAPNRFVLVATEDAAVNQADSLVVRAPALRDER